MPINFNFDTTNGVQNNTSSYNFLTPAGPAEPIVLGFVDGSFGSFALADTTFVEWDFDLVFYGETDLNFLPSFDFTVFDLEDTVLNFYGSTATVTTIEVDFDVSKYTFNFDVEEYINDSFEISEFETYTEIYEGFYGSKSETEFTVEFSGQYSFGLCYYETPNLNFAEFILGEEVCENFASYKYGSIFDSPELLTNPDLTHNFGLCETSLQGISQSSTTNLNDETDITGEISNLPDSFISTNWVYTFGENITECDSVTSYFSVDFSYNIIAHPFNIIDYGCITIEAPEVFDRNFNLLKDTPTYDIELAEIDYIEKCGVNLNYDFNICDDQSNPPLTSEITLVFFEDYEYECLGWVLDGYYGESAIASLQPAITFRAYGNYGSSAFFNYLGEDITFDIIEGFYGDTLSGVMSGQHIAQDLDTDGIEAYFNIATELLTLAVEATFPCDAYYGDTADADLTIFAAQTIVGDAYYGDTFVSDLSLQFNFEADAYYGDISQLGTIEVGQQFVIDPDGLDAYYGDYNDDDLFLSIDSVLVADAHYGDTLEFTIITAPSVTLDEFNAYYGDTFVAEELNVEVGFGFADANYGDTAELETIVVPEPETLEVDFYYGDIFDQPSLSDIGEKLTGDAYYGDTAILDKLSSNSRFVADAYYGDTLFADLSENPVDLIEADAHYGDTLADLYLGTSVNLYIRNYHGQYSDADLTTVGFDVFTLDSMFYGDTASVETLTFDPWVFDFYYGDTLELETFDLEGLAIEPMFYGDTAFVPAEGFRDTDIIFRLNELIYGATGEVDVDFAEPEQLEPNAYYGDAGTVNIVADIPPKLSADGYFRLNFFDAQGGIINHCYTNSDNLTYETRLPQLQQTPPTRVKRIFPPLSGYLDGSTYVEGGPYDNHFVNFDFNSDEDLLVSDARNYYEKATWSMCGSGHIADMEVSLAGQVRFEAESSGSETFISLIGLDQAVVLELGFIESLSFGHKYEMKAFESDINIRFCPGYLLPVGNNNNFEFTSLIKTECFSYNAYYETAFAEPVLLRCEPAVRADYTFGNYSRATLYLQEAWVLRGYYGHKSYANLNVKVPLEPRTSYYGSYGTATFPEYPVLGYFGFTMDQLELSVPGPAIRWITPAGCLENQYLPLNDTREVDYVELATDPLREKYPLVPLELKPFRSVVLATCTSDGDFEEEIEEDVGELCTPCYVRPEYKDLVAATPFYVDEPDYITQEWCGARKCDDQMIVPGMDEDEN